MTKAEYAAYLQSDYWRERRWVALERALHRCQGFHCRLEYLRSLTNEELAFERDEILPPNAYRLEVHHLSYERLGQEAHTDLIVLCPECHADYHGIAHVEEPFTTSIGDALASGLTAMLNEPAADADA